MRIFEPAADLAVAAALLSSISNQALPYDQAVFGEISLSGAVRPVAQTGARLKEASKLGFTSALAALPANHEKSPLKVTDIDDLRLLLTRLGLQNNKSET